MQNECGESCDARSSHQKGIVRQKGITHGGFQRVGELAATTGLNSKLGELARPEAEAQANNS